MKGLILAGGSGTGLRPLTHTGPKQLIPIANKPNILYCLEDIRNAGIKDIGVILGENMPEKVRELLGDGSEHGVNITYIVQGEPKGIAHAVGCARDFMGDEPFVVYLGDNVLKGGIGSMVEDFLEGNFEAQIALSEVVNPERFGVAVLNEEGNIIDLEEKPKKPKSNLALVGIYMFRNSIFPIIDSLKPSWRNEFEITEAIDNLRIQSGSIKAYVVTGWWKDTGKPEDILEANHLILEDLESQNQGQIEVGAKINGRFSIGKGTIVRPGAVIRGPVIIGENCEIGSKTYIGPYTSIGDNTSISKVEIESSIIIGDSKIECNKKIINSLIGKGSLIVSEEDKIPKGVKLVIGENSLLAL